MMVDFRAALSSATIDWTASQANGRLGRPEEMAPPLVFLNSDDASYVSGHNLRRRRRVHRGDDDRAGRSHSLPAG